MSSHYTRREGEGGQINHQGRYVAYGDLKTAPLNARALVVSVGWPRTDAVASSLMRASSWAGVMEPSRERMVAARPAT